MLNNWDGQHRKLPSSYSTFSRTKGKNNTCRETLFKITCSYNVIHSCGKACETWPPNKVATNLVDPIKSLYVGYWQQRHLKLYYIMWKLATPLLIESIGSYSIYPKLKSYPIHLLPKPWPSTNCDWIPTHALIHPFRTLLCCSHMILILIDHVQSIEVLCNMDLEHVDFKGMFIGVNGCCPNWTWMTYF